MSNKKRRRDKNGTFIEMKEQYDSRSLIYTSQGKKWLAQFDALDREVAAKIANSLILVSHNEFRRRLIEKIEKAATQYDGFVALYAVREVEREDTWGRVKPYFSQVEEDKKSNTVSSVSNSSDQGSEAIVAQIIRNLAKSEPRFLNHPTIEKMRSTKCEALIFVDDIIGSGSRVWQFIDSFMAERSVRSWKSLKYINIDIVAYSGTEQGQEFVCSHQKNPNLHIYRDAPSLFTMPIQNHLKKRIGDVCGKYGRIANKNKKHMWLGYKEGMAALIFEHGCPNNTPNILWEPGYKNSGWTGLFPNRTVTSSTQSVFPNEIAKGKINEILKDAGQIRLARSSALLRRGEIGSLVLLVLALIAKGYRKRSAICYAARLNVDEYSRLIDRCITFKFITIQLRITQKGLSEINAARFERGTKKTKLEEGSDYYYPQQLRGATID